MRATIFFSLRGGQLRTSLLLPLLASIATLLPLLTYFQGIDDDRGTRAQYKGLARKLGISKENVRILGAVYAEVENACQEILAADDQDHDVLCIFDQNLDQYPEGVLLGTDIVKKLVHAKFSGIIFIRSGNDSMDDIKLYREAGATDVLTKNANVAVLAMEVLVKYNHARKF